ncbi:VOC family protein [Streptomyces sp. NPDC060048]|uniref:VOC family protein n=1 Tax=unclassified Streptomyces TaxID=2593676 RepID=UPI003689D512
MSGSGYALSHVDLSVSDLDHAEKWYGRLLDATCVLDGTNDEYGFAFRYLKTPAGTLLGLIQHTERDTAPFSPRRTGLDHLSFAVDSPEELRVQLRKLTDLRIPNSGIIEQPTGDAIAFRDPDGIQLEFYRLTVQP